MTAFTKLRTLLDQSDVRAQPARAVWRRLRWRLHWRRSESAPFVVDPWTSGLSIALPRAGAAAQIYYRTFSSQPLADFVRDTVPRGGTFIDVGAHVGEYSLLGAVAAGPTGSVHAVEPQPAFAALIEANARHNGLHNIVVHQMAVADRPTTLALSANEESGGAWIGDRMSAEVLTVDCLPLSELIVQAGGPADLLKLDCAGSEAAALRGSQGVLVADVLPIVAWKLYHPDVVADRFGDDAFESVRLFQEHGYRLWLLRDPPHPVRDRASVFDLMGDRWYSIPVVAAHESVQLPTFRSKASPRRQ